MLSHWIRTIPPRTMFAIDAMGALVSAGLALVAAQLEGFLGIPGTLLYYMAGLISLYFLFSGYCFISRPQNWQKMLRIISIANFLYCPIGVAVLFCSSGNLTIWGILYLGMEMAVVAALAYFEWKVAARPQ